MNKKLAICIISVLLVSFVAASVASATPVDAPSSHLPGSIDNRGYGLTDTAWDDVKWSTTPSNSHNNQYPPYFQMKWSTGYASYLSAWTNLPGGTIDTLAKYNGWINYGYTWSSIVPNNNYETEVQVKGVGSTGNPYNMQVRFYAYDSSVSGYSYSVLDNIGLTV